MFRFTELAFLVASWSLAAAHTVIVYPPWRGDNIITNGTVSKDNPDIIPGSLGINYIKDNSSSGGTYGFPYGMQWQYPCGGMPTGQNRTKWPIKGGAVAIQPGWFPGHSQAQFFINMGYGNEPLNYSHNIINSFQITGPTNVQYNGTFCLPQVPLPANYTPNVGDNATIQIIELAQHGASLFNCADITFAEPEDVPQVNSSNCFNSSDIGFQQVYAESLSAAVPTLNLNPYVSMLLPLALASAAWMTWL